jgi:hypothetical protein
MRIRFLVPFLVPLALWASTSYMHLNNFGTEGVCFSKQDARGNLVVASLPVNFPLSAFLPKVSCANVHWTEHESYLSYSLKSLNWHFLAWPSPSKATQYSLGMESPRSFPNSWIRLIVTCLMTVSLCFTHGDSAGLPCYKILCSRILNIPLPYGMRCLKVSPKGHHIFERLRPQQHRSTVDVTRDSRGWSLSVPFSCFSGSGA